METEGKHYVIGIDLGTTNSAVAYIHLQSEPFLAATTPQQKAKQIKIFKVPQLTGAGEVTGLRTLPSFHYIPGTYDISKDAVALPWGTEEDNFVGAFARDHGARVPARLVSSAKSWLCHANVDRHAHILPWGSSDEVQKISPVKAIASYLQHVRRAWNHAQPDEEERYLENQIIIITVPASFDEVARDLTVEAAAMAGLKNIILLEEPLAAFYSWLIRHEHEWDRFVQPNELILVCDIGGGTTDFTLITLRVIDGEPRFERIAVGDHLILGGDNIDLALARLMEAGLGKGKISLSGDKWKTLCHQCRQAKERILDGTSESERITMVGAGSKLIGGTISAVLERASLEKTVLDGFFPPVDKQALSRKIARKGITEFGLPYESEPAMTLHLGCFLEQHQADVQQLLNKPPQPDHILFNGGSLKPAVIQERIRESIRHWFKEDDQRLPQVLENPDPDLAVALGAAYYGLVKIGKGVRVGSGSPRSYYLGIARKAEDLCEQKAQALCLVERGLNEGSEISLPDKKFEVLANRPVRFDMFSSSYRSGDRCGDVIEVDDSLTVLPPIQTLVKFGKKDAKKSIPVNIEAHYTEIGTLAVWCRSLVSDHRWKLQFQLRDTEGRSEVADETLIEDSVAEEACAQLRTVFDEENKVKNEMKADLDRLPKMISDIAAMPKEKWPLTFIRQLTDELIKRVDARKRSAEHESRWLNLVGYCLRPGFGDGFDEQRVKKIWKIYHQGVQFGNNLQVATEWWILWRRLAGGLKAGQQRQISQDLSPIIMPKKSGKAKLSIHERLEIWMTIANLERLLVKDKIMWGRQLLSELSPKKCHPQNLWSLSRIGARELLYGSHDKVIPPKEVAQWIETILSTEWRNPKPVGQSLVQMARKTGDRMRDIDPQTIDKIVKWLARIDGFSGQLTYLKSVVPLERQEENTIFGESLPAGLILH